MADSLRISRRRPALEGGGSLEKDFISVPDGSGIEVWVNGALVATHVGDVEVRYSLAGTGGAMTQSPVTEADAKSKFNRHIPLSER